ncbi:Crp/Fnr family transcriptional regulator [Aliirhizobium terrae]|uniref:Crp/Fnr family transcriptional regulator n=1 Tax=Terrirhizobium terrae TaxID=2926709 RepID=UPI00257699BB|nr:Crp/Fnr family transcriptional regulator [Rhizobium sp. CC-CFT758]WJH41117.1 Crp/Fnr family transcriptional regulator [Rhizobium sp. CC-CFT758]
MMQISPFIRRVTALLPSPGLMNPALETINYKSMFLTKGTEILGVGWTGKQVLTIGQGIAMRYRILPDGSRQVIMFLMPGDICNPHIYPATIDHYVAAVTPVRIDRFDCESLIHLTNTIVGMNEALWTLAEEQNAIMRDHITSLGRADTRLRVIMLLMEMVKRLGPQGSNEPVMIPVTQSLLADTVGVTHIHFNRIVSELVRRGIVDTCRGGIQIRDMSWLAGMAEEIIEAA